MSCWPLSVPTSSTSSCSAAATVPPGWTTPSTRRPGIRWSPVRPNHARSDQPCAARLGRVLRPVCRARRRRGGAPPRPLRGGRACHLALEDVALATAGNLGLLTEPQVNRNPAATPGQRHLRPVRPGLHQRRTGSAFMVVMLTGRHFRDIVDATGTGSAVSALAEALGVDFAVEGDRYRYRDVLSGLFAVWFADHTAEEIAAALSRHHRVVRAVPHFRGGRRRPAGDRQSVVFPAAPTRRRRLSGPGLPAAFDGAHTAATAAPALGQDTADVLTECLGLTAADIARLADAKTIACEGRQRMTKLAQTLGPDRVSDRDPRHGPAIRRQGDHPQRAGTRARRHLPAGHRRPDAGNGPVRPDDPGGVRRAGGVAADLRAVRRGAGARLDERVRRHQYPLHRRLHAAPARHRRAAAAVPAADGDRRVARRVLDVRAGTGFRRRRDPDQGRAQSGWRLHHQRPEDVADQRRQLDAGRRAGPHRRGRGQAAPQPDRVPGREANGFRRGRAGPDDPRQDRQDGLQGHRHHRADLRRLPAPAPTTSSAARPGRASSR